MILHIYSVNSMLTSHKTNIDIILKTKIPEVLYALTII